MARSIAIIGAGPGGICTGLQLLARGHHDFVVLEAAPGTGGTWWHNTYPGAACDVPSALYSFSFAPKLDWTRPYATQQEIRSYLDDCIEHGGLRPHIRCSTPVLAARWIDTDRQWELELGGTAAGELLRCDVLVGAVGMFGAPMRPEIPGLDEFPGPVVHSARWNDTVELAGRRVAVIGSAASAVQLVPAIAPDAAALTVFQRTANWVLPKADVPYTADEIAAHTADPTWMATARAEAFTRTDLALTFADPIARAKTEAWARRSFEIVEDPETRAALTPDHPFGCKRPLLSNEWFPTFNRSNVHLVTAPIEAVRDGAVCCTDGTRHAADVIVLATGFDTTSFLSVVDVHGRNGHRIRDDWRTGAHAYLGITTHGFPNLFMLYGPNTNNGSILFVIEQQVQYLLRHLDRMDHDGLTWTEVRADAEAEYNARLQHDLDGVDVWQADCSNYYRGADGRIVTQWPHSMREYERRTSADDFANYEVG